MTAHGETVSVVSTPPGGEGARTNKALDPSWRMEDSMAFFGSRVSEGSVVPTDVMPPLQDLVSYLRADEANLSPALDKAQQIVDVIQQQWSTTEEVTEKRAKEVDMAIAAVYELLRNAVAQIQKSSVLDRETAVQETTRISEMAKVLGAAARQVKNEAREIVDHIAELQKYWQGEGKEVGVIAATVDETRAPSPATPTEPTEATVPVADPPIQLSPEQRQAVEAFEGPNRAELNQLFKEAKQYALEDLVNATILDRVDDLAGDVLALYPERLQQFHQLVQEVRQVRPREFNQGLLLQPADLIILLALYDQLYAGTSKGQEQALEQVMADASGVLRLGALDEVKRALGSSGDLKRVDLATTLEKIEKKIAGNLAPYQSGTAEPVRPPVARRIEQKTSFNAAQRIMAAIRNVWSQ